MVFYCDSNLEYRDYAIFDLTDVDKTKEDFWDPEEEFYDIWSFEDYLFNQDGALMRGEDVVGTLNGLSKECESLKKEKNKLAIENHILRKDLQKLFNLLMERGMTFEELHDFLWDCEAAK